MRQNNYKQNHCSEKMKRGANRRGQLTILVIVALIIVAILIVFLIYPRLSPLFSSDLNPTTYLSSCIEPTITDTVAKLNQRGGYLNPEGTILYQDVNIKYLCYTPEFYKMCIVQQPMIKNHYEQELAQEVNTKALTCLTSLKDEYKRRGYEVTAGAASSSVSIVPNKISTVITVPLSANKGGVVQTFNSFSIETPSQMYDLLMLSQNIIQFEATLGDSETTLYLMYYPNLKIEKTKLSDGTKIYRVSDVTTKEKFSFASRSLSWPPGYGTDK